MGLLVPQKVSVAVRAHLTVVRAHLLAKCRSNILNSLECIAEEREQTKNNQRLRTW
jgi:hypothetical protein